MLLHQGYWGQPRNTTLNWRMLSTSASPTTLQRLLRLLELWIARAPGISLRLPLFLLYAQQKWLPLPPDPPNPIAPVSDATVA